MSNVLIDNIDKVHTTEMGVDRIRKNLGLDNVDVVEWCKTKILAGMPISQGRERTGMSV